MKKLYRCRFILSNLFAVFCVAGTLIPLLGCERGTHLLKNEKVSEAQLLLINHANYINLQPGLYRMNVHYREVSAYTKDGTIEYLQTMLPVENISEACKSVLEYTLESGEMIKLCESHVVRIYLQPQPPVFNNEGEETLKIWKIHYSAVFPQVVVKIEKKRGIRSDIKRTFYEYEGELIETLTHPDLP